MYTINWLFNILYQVVNTIIVTSVGINSFSPPKNLIIKKCSIQFSHSVMSDSLQPRGLQYARPPCPSPTPRVYSNSYPLRRGQWQPSPVLLPGKSPWMQEPGGLQSTGSHRVGHDWATSLSLFTFMHWRRKWQPTPVFLAWRIPGTGKPGGLPMGSHRVGHDWSDLAAAAMCPLSQWCHLTISSSVVPFSSCLQSLPASGSFQMSQLFVSGGQSVGVSASAVVLLVNIQDWFLLGWTDWISLQSKGLSRVLSNTTVQKHQFFSAQLSL